MCYYYFLTNFPSQPPNHCCAVLELYDDPSNIAAAWAVQPSERGTPSARVSHVLSYIQRERQGICASRSLIASTRFKTGSVVFLYRGAALSSACVSEYEDHQPSVEVCNCSHSWGFCHLKLHSSVLFCNQVASCSNHMYRNSSTLLPCIVQPRMDTHVSLLVYVQFVFLGRISCPLPM